MVRGDQLFGRSFSSYTWKALIALHEDDTPFDFRIIDPEHPENGTELARHWPQTKCPRAAAKYEGEPL